MFADQGLAGKLRRADNIHLVSLWFQQELDGFEDMLLIVSRQDSWRTRSFRQGGRDGYCMRLGRSWHFKYVVPAPLLVVSRSRGAHGSVDRVLNLDSIMFQSRSGRTINLNFGLLVNRHRCDQVQFREG
jgi:hypothetical protein